MKDDLPSPEAQLTFITNIQRVLTEGAFTQSYKFALLIALVELAAERADDASTALELDSRDLAEKFIAIYWRQTLDWQPPAGGPEPRPLFQGNSEKSAILDRIADARLVHPTLYAHRRDAVARRALVTEVADVIVKQPLWLLQRVGGRPIEFLYRQGSGPRMTLFGEAVYCLRRHHHLVLDLVRGRWARFVRDLSRNQPLLASTERLERYLFGTDRRSLVDACAFLRQLDDRCFYCRDTIGSSAQVDHFIPWAGYPLDSVQNYVITDRACNNDKRDRLASEDHLRRWYARNRDSAFRQLVTTSTLISAPETTDSLVRCAYAAAEVAGAYVWKERRDQLVRLETSWRTVFEQDI